MNNERVEGLGMRLAQDVSKIATKAPLALKQNGRVILANATALCMYMYVHVARFCSGISEIYELCTRMFPVHVQWLSGKSV